MRRIADRLHVAASHASVIGRISATQMSRRCTTKAVGGLFDRLKRMYAEYELQRDRRDDLYASASPCGEQSVCARRIRETPGTCPRSVLMIPAAPVLRPPRGAEPDAVMFDLTAPPAQCAAARDAVLRHVEAAARDSAEQQRQTQRRYIIRVSSPEFDARNGLLDLELVALLGDRIEAVALPMVTPNTFALVEPYVHPAQRLWAVFDSPRSIAHATAVCAQGHYACAVLGERELRVHLGYASLSGFVSPLGGGDTEAAMLRALPLLHSSCQVIFAARAYGMHVLDGPFADAADTLGFSRDVQRSRWIGVDGRVISHGAHVAMCNRAFVPTEAEVEWAQEALYHKSQRQWAAQLLIERHRDAEMEKEEQQQPNTTTTTTTADAQEEK